MSERVPDSNSRRRRDGPQRSRRFGWILVFLVIAFAAGVLAGPYGERLSGVDIAAVLGLEATLPPDESRVSLAATDGEPLS